jgi:two-component system alkaline phosphatase synthesis response regulator PhoP
MIYCVEDDNNIRDLVVYALKTAGYEALGFPDGARFYQEMKNKIPSLVLLDVMLPDIDGFTILKQLKSSEQTKDMPVIMLTAKGSEFDKVRGLDEGADDYVTKPFSVMELLSRVKAVLRRTGPAYEEKEIVIANLILNKERHEVRADGQEIKLTLKEFELLNYLMENRGIVLSRDKILEKIWGYEFERETRTVDVHIRRLRHKLGVCGDTIQTVRGLGYRIGGTE